MGEAKVFALNKLSQFPSGYVIARMVKSRAARLIVEEIRARYPYAVAEPVLEWFLPRASLPDFQPEDGIGPLQEEMLCIAPGRSEALERNRELRLIEGRSETEEETNILFYLLEDLRKRFNGDQNQAAQHAVALTGRMWRIIRHQRQLIQARQTIDADFA